MDLAGDASIPIAGTILDPLSGGATYAGIPRDFELLLSDDGADWQVALTGQLSPLPIEQSFALPAPIPARFAQLRILSMFGGASNQLVLGEWKVVAAPGATVDSAPLDIASWKAGGHIVWMDPQSDDPGQPTWMLSDDQVDHAVPADPGQRPTWVMGFNEDRAAQVTELQWADSPSSVPEDRAKTVDIAVSLTSPLGPWTDVGTWKLHRDQDGSVAPYVFQAPTWARFLRYTTDPVRDEGISRALPATLRALERPTDASYRSVLGQWGQDRSEGPQEWITPPTPIDVTSGPDGNDTPATATPLASGTPVSGRVHIDEDVDWYSLSIPEGANSVRLHLSGTPTLAARVSLYDASGTSVPLVPGPRDASGGVEYLATVTGGGTYTVKVEQPPFSAVVSFDNSGSMSPYLAFVSQALRAYTGGIVPVRRRCSSNRSRSSRCCRTGATMHMRSSRRPPATCPRSAPAASRRACTMAPCSLRPATDRARSCSSPMPRRPRSTRTRSCGRSWRTCSRNCSRCTSPGRSRQSWTST